MNDNEKAKISAVLINKFDFNLAYKVAVVCGMSWWKSPHDIKESAIEDISSLLDNEEYHEVSSGGLGAYKEEADGYIAYFLRFIPIYSMVIGTKNDTLLS